MLRNEETAAAIEYLRARGHDIGQVFMPPDGNGMRWWIDERACTSKDIRELAALERLKPPSTTVLTMGNSGGTRELGELGDRRDVF